MTKDNSGPAFPVCPGQQNKITERFLKYVDLGDGNLSNCWNWNGAVTPRGYGVFFPTRKSCCRAHRIAFKIYWGREPVNLILHTCDNPSCVNPKHLLDGTHKENMRQMAERKRAAREERHHKSKLLKEEVIAIWVLYRSGEYNNRELAEMFNVVKETVVDITSGKTWKDISKIADAMLKDGEEK